MQITKTRWKNIQQYYSDRRAVLSMLKKDLEKNYAKPLIKELQKYPPKRRYPQDYPIQFTSDKQRRYVMMMLNGKPYQRTNRMKNSWKYKVDIKRTRVVLRVENTWEESKYVMGKFGLGKSERQIQRYTKPIQRFHQTTGWRSAYQIYQKHVTPAKKRARKIVQEWYKKGFE